MSNAGPTNCRECGAFYREHRSELIRTRDMDAGFTDLVSESIDSVADMLGVSRRLVEQQTRFRAFDRQAWMTEWFERFHAQDHVYTPTEGN